MGDFEKCPVVKCVIVKVISQNPHPFEECTKVFPKLRIFALRGSSSSNRRPDPFANYLKFSPMSWLSVWEYSSFRGQILVLCEHAYGRPLGKSRRIFTYSEVFRMLVGARTPRNRAIISFVLQSGQRVGVITKIRYGDVRKQIENSISPVVIDVDPNISKNRVRHSFAIGRECVDFIKSMMKDRERWGEPIDDESILFRSLGVGKRWIEGQLLPGGSIDRSERGWAFRTGQIGWIMRKAATDAGVTLNKMTHTSFPRWSHFELHPHAFRRWWKSMMRRGGVKDPVFLDFMLGHYEPYDGAYDAFDHDYIRQEYAKAEPQLTFLRDRSELAHSQQENNSQRIVDEHEASALLSEGWRFVTTLPSGRLVVQKDPSPRAMGA